jgi:hypothetical protein
MLIVAMMFSERPTWRCGSMRSVGFTGGNTGSRLRISSPNDAAKISSFLHVAPWYRR